MDEQELIHSPACVLAVDPGLSGAVCRLGRGHFDVRRDFKLRPDIALAIRDLAGDVSRAVMELVHAMPGQGVCSMFSFGRASGVADGALAVCLACPVEEVFPQKWQNFFRQWQRLRKEDPFDSRVIAANILPSSSPYLTRVKDHNTADAVLIAAWWLLTHTFQNAPVRPM